MVILHHIKLIIFTTNFKQNNKMKKETNIRSNINYYDIHIILYSLKNISEVQVIELLIT